MSNVISYENYKDEYLIYTKIINKFNKDYKVVIRINKKLTSSYYVALIRKKFNAYDFDIEELCDFLIQNEIFFKLYQPLKNVKGYYYMHFPKNQSYLNHYCIDDDKPPFDKRDIKDFEKLDFLN